MSVQAPRQPSLRRSRPSLRKDMASFEDELLLDAEMDAQEVVYIRSQMDEKTSERWEDDDIYYFIDLIATYYAESGLLDAEPDADGFIDLPMDAIVEYLQKNAQRELQKSFTADDLALIVEADMNFAEEN